MYVGKTKFYNQLLASAYILKEIWNGKKKISEKNMFVFCAVYGAYRLNNFYYERKYGRMSNKQNYFNNILVYSILCIVFACSLTACGVQKEIKIN